MSIRICLVPALFPPKYRWYEDFAWWRGKASQERKDDLQVFNKT
jgi:hypothetical protein